MSEQEKSDYLNEKLLICMDEENRIIAEMEKVLADAPDRIEAEKIVVKKWAPLMDEALKKSNDALQEWVSCTSQESDEASKEIEEGLKELEAELKE